MFKQSHLVKIFWAVINLVEGQVGLQKDRQSNLEGGGSTKKTAWRQGDRLHRKKMSTKEREHQGQHKHRESQSKPEEKENRYKERSVYADSAQTENEHPEVRAGPQTETTKVGIRVSNFVWSKAISTLSAMAFCSAL